MEGSINPYLRRAFNFSQMDLDYTFCQMIYICFKPHKLTQLTDWRKSSL